MFEGLLKWATNNPLIAIPAAFFVFNLFCKIGCVIRRHFFAACAFCGKSADYAVKSPEGKQRYCAECFEYRRDYFEWLEENQEGFSYAELGESSDEEDEDEEDEEDNEDEEEDELDEEEEDEDSDDRK